MKGGRSSRTTNGGVTVNRRVALNLFPAAFVFFEKFQGDEVTWGTGSQRTLRSIP